MSSKIDDSQQPGMLWQQVIQRTEAALACGALQSIPTIDDRLEQDGLNFIVRVSRNVARKQAVAKKTSGTNNPFLPYEEDLFVTDLSETHVALLNKFNVVDHHLLIITRQFEAQESWLTLADFTALARCMVEIDGLAFYNGGQAAGASQKHKHLQLVPLVQNSEEVPIEMLMTGLDQTQLSVPFLHALTPLALNWSVMTQTLAENLYQCYHRLYAAIGQLTESPPQPYNLLVTRRWMLLVLRSQESYAGISVNALGFAGSLFVRNHEQLQQLQQIGPMTLLQKVTYPR